MINACTANPGPVPLTILRSNSKFNETSECSCSSHIPPIAQSRHFAQVTTVILSLRVPNFVVIGSAYFKLEHCKFWSHFEFDRNTVYGRVPGISKCAMNMFLHLVFVKGASLPAGGEPIVVPILDNIKTNIFSFTSMIICLQVLNQRYSIELGTFVAFYWNVHAYAAS